MAIGGGGGQLATTTAQESHEKLKQIVSEIHSQYSLSNYYGGVGGSITPGPMNQLVPYNNPSETKTSLTADALKKLYSMAPYNRPAAVSFNQFRGRQVSQIVIFFSRRIVKINLISNCSRKM